MKRLVGSIVLAVVVCIGPVALLTRFAHATLLLQDIASAGAFQGQDIMGGAAIIFKRPQRMRDLVGSTSLVVVKKATRGLEVARNTSPDRRRPNATTSSRQGQTGVTEGITASDRAEAFKTQAGELNEIAVRLSSEAAKPLQNSITKSFKDFSKSFAA